MAQKANVDYHSNLISADDIVQHIIHFGFTASLLDSTSSHQGFIDLQVMHTFCHFLQCPYLVSILESFMCKKNFVVLVCLIQKKFGM